MRARAEAADLPEGYLDTRIVWQSEASNACTGFAVYGGTIDAVLPLAKGVHTLTASVGAPNGLFGSQSVIIALGEPPVATVTQMAYSTAAGNRALLDVEVALASGVPVVDGAVTVSLARDGVPCLSISAATDEDGVARLDLGDLAPGTYTATITDISAFWTRWDGVTPPNSLTK